MERNSSTVTDCEDCEENVNDVHDLQFLDEIFEKFEAQETTNHSDIGKDIKIGLLISIDSMNVLT